LKLKPENYKKAERVQYISLLAIPIGYLIGSLPFSFIVGWLWNRSNIIEEGDGHISATAVYRRAGIIPFIIVLLLDIGKGICAIQVACLMTSALWVILAAGIATVIGHCWSLYLRFMGGLGATVMYGVMAAVNIWVFLIAIMATMIFFLITKKSGIATILFVVVSAVLLPMFTHDILTFLFPLILLMMQQLKRLQMVRSGADSRYRNEFYDDFRRNK
jgi:glycerol-3-phosphate acyltransferase PlsY